MSLFSKQAKFMNAFGNILLKPVFYRMRYAHTNPVAHQGAQECQRRIAQGNAGECYVKGSEYPIK